MKRKINWKHVAKVLLVTTSIVLLAMTPWFNGMANESRMVSGFGGECLIWIFPILGCGFIN